PGAEILTGLKCRDTDEAAEHRAVDIAPLPMTAAVEQRRDDRISGIQAGAEIADRNAALHRAAAFLAGDTHDPAHRLNGDIEGPPFGIGAGLAISADGAEDKSGVAWTDAFVSQPEAFHHARAVILEHDVGDLAKLANALDVARILCIQRHAS